MSALSFILALAIWTPDASSVIHRPARNQSPTINLAVELPTLDLMCVCGKGGTCTDRSVRLARLPTTPDECQCNISVGLYRDCDVLVDHCDVDRRPRKDANDEGGVCLNGGRCTPTFGGFYCACTKGYIGRRCEYYRPFGGVRFVTKPSTFHFLHSVTKRRKKLFLLAETLGTQFQAVVDYHDRRPQLILTEDDFFDFNLFDYCINTVIEFPVAFDPDACYLYPQNVSRVAVIEPSFPRGIYKHSKTGRNDIINITYLNHGYITFHQKLNFFTPFYGFHEKPDPEACDYLIVFRGCGVYFNTDHTYYAHDTIQVTAVSKPLKLCKPITRHRGLWRYYPNSSEIYVEDVDERNNIKTFHPFTFDVGVRKIEYYHIDYGDRHHYGINREFVSKGECTVNIQKGRADIQFVGGIRRSYPCFEPIYLQVESSHPICFMAPFEVTWSCNGTIENCKPEKALDETIVYEPLECGQTYKFKAVMKSRYFSDSTANQDIQLLEEIPILQIICVYNCVRVIQSTASARFSTSISVMSDALPTWTIEVDNKTVIVENRTDEDSFFMPGPLSFLKGNRTFKIIATLDGLKSELELPVAMPSFNGSCYVETNRVFILRPFNIKCSNVVGPHVTFFAIDRSAQAGKANSIAEPVAESNNIIMFNIIVRHTGLFMLVLDPYWWEPVAMNTFKRPIIVKHDHLKPMREMENAFRLINQAMYNGDHYGALEEISVAAFTAGFLDEHLITGRKLDLLNTLKKLQFRHTLTELAKIVAVLFRLGYMGQHGLIEDDDDAGNHHTLMHAIAIVSRELKKVFEKLSDAPNQPEWNIGTRKNFILSLFGVCNNAIMMSFHEIRYRASRKNYEFPEFLYETNEGGHIILGILKSIDSTAYPVQLYENPYGLKTKFLAAWFQVDEHSEIEKDMTANLTDMFIVRDHKDVPSRLIYYQHVRMAKICGWWISARNFTLVADIITSTAVDYETQKILKFPINIAHFSINLSETFLVEGLTVKGQAKLDDENRNIIKRQSELYEEKKDRLLIVWQYHIPPASTGMLFVTFLPSSAERKMYLKLNRFPSYNDVYSLSSDRGDQVRSVTIDKPAIGKIQHQAYVAVLPDGNVTNGRLDYELHAFTLSCITYGNQDWKSGECKLRFNKSISQIKCVCPRITWHSVEKVILSGRQLLVHHDLVVMGVAKNYTVLVATSVLSAAFVVLFIWSVFKDRKKDFMDAVYLLDSSKGGFVYLISVSTGHQIGAGSDSSIGFRLIGTKARSGPHLFRYRQTKRRLFTMKENFFLLVTPVHLGEILRIDVWNDFTGVFPDWKCQSINVYDLGLENVVEFDRGFWLSRAGTKVPGLLTVEKPNIEDFPAVPTVESNKFEELVAFIMNQLWEKHRWISIFFLSKRNIYQHREKVLILASFIIVVVGFAMFYSEILAGGILDSSRYVFDDQQVVITALSLVTAYIEYFLLILFLEKSNEFTKRVRPAGTIVFKQAHYRRKRHHSFESRSVSVRSMKKFALLAGKLCSKFHKLWWAHIYGPTNYFTSFSPGNIRNAGRPKIKSWLYASWFFATGITLAIITYLFVFGFRLGRFRSYQWLTVCCIAIVVDAFVLDPVRIVIVTSCLFFIRHRRLLDSYYIQGYYEVRIKEEHKMNYYKELGRVVFKRVDDKSLRRKAMKIVTNVWLSKWYTFFTLIILLSLMYWTIRAFDVRTQFRGNENAVNLVAEPLIASPEPNFLFSDVKNSSLFVNYLNLTLFPNIHRHRWYNGKFMPAGIANPFSIDLNLTDPWQIEEYVRGWCADYDKKLIKSVILFQTRVRLDSIATSYFWTNAGNLTDSPVYVIETRNFSKKWRPYDPLEIEDPNWIYSDDYGVKSTLWNVLKHPISGYVVNLPPGMAPKKREVLLLHLENWWDNCTRSVEVLFNMYAASTDLATSVRIVFKVSPGGYYDGRAESETQYIALYGKKSRDFYTLLYIMICFFLWSSLRVCFFLEKGGFRSYRTETFPVLDGIVTFVSLLLVITQGLVIAKFYFVGLEWERVSRFEYYKLFEAWSFEPYINITLVFATLFLIHCFLVFFNQLNPADSLKLNGPYFESASRIVLTSFLIHLFLDECVKCYFFIYREPIQLNLINYSILKDFEWLRSGFLNDIYDVQVRFMSILFILVRLFGLAIFVCLCQMKSREYTGKSYSPTTSSKRYDFDRRARMMRRVMAMSFESSRPSRLWGFFSSHKDSLARSTLNKN